MTCFVVVLNNAIPNPQSQIPPLLLLLLLFEEKNEEEEKERNTNAVFIYININTYYIHAII